VRFRLRRINTHGLEQQQKKKKKPEEEEEDEEEEKEEEKETECRFKRSPTFLYVLLHPFSIFTQYCSFHKILYEPYTAGSFHDSVPYIP
jgi:hypothetical protein